MTQTVTVYKNQTNRGVHSETEKFGKISKNLVGWLSLITADESRSKSTIINPIPEY